MSEYFNPSEQRLAVTRLYAEIDCLKRDLSEITTANTVIRYERDDALAEISRLKEEVTRLSQYEDAITAAKDGVLVVWNLMDTNSTVIANDYWQNHLEEIDRLKAELEEATILNGEYKIITGAHKRQSERYENIYRREFEAKQQLKAAESEITELNDALSEVKRQLAEAKEREDIDSIRIHLFDEEVAELEQSAINFHEALLDITKIRLEPAHCYEQAVKMQEIAKAALMRSDV